MVSGPRACPRRGKAASGTNNITERRRATGQLCRIVANGVRTSRDPHCLESCLASGLLSFGFAPAKARSPQGFLFDLVAVDPSLGLDPSATESRTAPANTRPMRDATRGTTGSKRQPPGSEHFVTRILPSKASNRPIERTIIPKGIPTRLVRDVVIASDFRNQVKT